MATNLKFINTYKINNILIILDDLDDDCGHRFSETATRQFQSQHVRL